MQRLVSNKISNFVRICIPVTLSIILIFLSVLPYGFPKSALAAPILALISVYYWSVFRPDLMPASAAFLLGLLVDILSAGPPGLNALAAAITWIVASLFHGIILDYVPLFVSHAMGTAAYPLVAVMLARVQTYTLPR